MIIQQLNQGPQEGKTHLLMTVANGAVHQGDKVLFILPNNEYIKIYKKLYGMKGMHVVNYRYFLSHMYLKLPHGIYNFILLDNCEVMNSEGDILKIINKGLKDCRKPVTVLGAY